MDYKKRNGLIIQQIKHFLVGVVDNNEEKRHNGIFQGERCIQRCER